MTPESLIDLFRHGVYLSILLVTVLVIPGLLVGLLIATFQAATQINESSLSFIPKLFATLIVAVVAGPWLLHLIVQYTQELYTDLPNWIG
jgi:flagellar biosynthetic protein FliQ